MQFGENLKKRLETLKKRGGDIPKIIKRVQEAATIEAVAKAAELTPVDTGQLQAHWGSDSTTTPKVEGDKYTTVLANNIQYASYVNDGFTMKQHFVPGLIQQNGSLLKVPPEMGGIIVGKTPKFIAGKHMRQAAVDLYREKLEKYLKEEMKVLFDG